MAILGSVLMLSLRLGRIRYLWVGTGGGDGEQQGLLAGWGQLYAT